MGAFEPAAPSLITRIVSFLPSLPATADLFTPKVIDIVGCSTAIGSSGRGSSRSTTVSPMLKSSMPANVTMSPADASSTGARPIASKAKSSVTLAGGDAREMPRCSRDACEVWPRCRRGAGEARTRCSSGPSEARGTLTFAGSQPGPALSPTCCALRSTPERMRPMPSRPMKLSLPMFEICSCSGPSRLARGLRGARRRGGRAGDGGRGWRW